MSVQGRSARGILQDIAHQAMLDEGLAPEFPPAALAEVDAVHGPAAGGSASVRDLRAMPWASIDNDDSRDLDQLSVAEALPDGACRLLVAIADVDALAPRGSAIDGHAEQNTTSVYTAARIFPMLPEKLSTDLTSLNEGQDRQAVVVEMVVDPAGAIRSSDVYRATVHNHAKLAYNSVAAWLDGKGPEPEGLAKVSGLDQNLRLQDQAADRLRARRIQEGALQLETLEPKAVFAGDVISDLALDAKNQAKELIEDLMVASNGVTARFLAKAGFPALRRIVRSPERWPRIAQLAAELGDSLPVEPDAKALNEFLARRRRADPVGFPDLSLTVVKLMGRGEYVVETGDGTTEGHFGLAVKDYTHSTAPNRRYPDLITQRLLKAALERRASPYAPEELEALARHCTQREDAANKVERRVRKSAAALLLSSRVRERFDAIVTGASSKGTWVRIFRPPVEGKVVRGFEGLDVGEHTRVELIRTDVGHGFIDFARVKPWAQPRGQEPVKGRGKARAKGRVTGPVKGRGKGGGRARGTGRGKGRRSGRR
jgi:VacB/RNase II family 3'-5' exoribonuclease